MELALAQVKAGATIPDDRVRIRAVGRVPIGHGHLGHSIDWDALARSWGKVSWRSRQRKDGSFLYRVNGARSSVIAFLGNVVEAQQGAELE